MRCMPWTQCTPGPARHDSVVTILGPPKVVRTAASAMHQHAFPKQTHHMLPRLMRKHSFPKICC